MNLGSRFVFGGHLNQIFNDRYIYTSSFIYIYLYICIIKGVFHAWHFVNVFFGSMDLGRWGWVFGFCQLEILASRCRVCVCLFKFQFWFLICFQISASKMAEIAPPGEFQGFIFFKVARTLSDMIKTLDCSQIVHFFKGDFKELARATQNRCLVEHSTRHQMRQA